MSAKQNEEGCVTVTWEIRNFALLLEADFLNWLWSPLWKVEHTEGGAKWWRLGAWYFASDFHFTFDLLEEDGTCSKQEFFIVSSGGEEPLEKNFALTSFIKKGALLDQNRQSLLPNDNLTLRCRMWNNTIQNRELSINSDLHEVNCLWNIENFDTEKIYNKCIEQSCFLLYVSLKKKSTNNITHVVTISGQCEEKCFNFVDCKMSFKDGVSHVTKKIFHPLYDKLECYVKIRTENNTNVCVELKLIAALHKVSYDAQQLAKCNVSEEIAQSSSAVCGDILLLFKEKLFCDATLTTEGQSFPTHKLVLAARSPVFRAMFEKRETSEGQSGVVAIDDVDGATLERMLVYLYVGRLGEVSWEEAAALYYAADKYDVRALKHKCAELLKAGLTADNVCDALVLADRHSDQDLMTYVVDFLFEHQEVISSTSWEELENSQPHLCAKITRQLLLRKGKIC